MFFIYLSVLRHKTFGIRNECSKQTVWMFWINERYSSWARDTNAVRSLVCFFNAKCVCTCVCVYNRIVDGRRRHSFIQWIVFGHECINMCVSIGAWLWEGLCKGEHYTFSFFLLDKHTQAYIYIKIIPIYVHACVCSPQLKKWVNEKEDCA